jgi:hypothetical protein
MLSPKTDGIVRIWDGAGFCSLLPPQLPSVGDVIGSIAFFTAEVKEVSISSIALQVLAAWVAGALIIGLKVGVSIRTAEELRIEEVSTDRFSFLAWTQSTKEKRTYFQFR